MLGLDSLMALEVRERLHKALGIRLAISKLLAGSTLSELVDHLVELWESSLGSPEATREASTRTAAKGSHV